MKFLFQCLVLIQSFGFISVSFATEEEFFTCKLPGQLGNQMFSAAAALSLAIDQNAKVYFPILRTSTKKHGNLSVNREKIFWRLDSSSPASEPSCIIKQTADNPTDFPLPYVRGMVLSVKPWSEKYFKHNASQVLPFFEPSQKILNHLHEKYNHIIKHPMSVSFHVRSCKGEPAARTRRPLYCETYFQLAMKHFPKDALFVVFSDDIEFCRKRLQHIDRNFIFMNTEPYYHDFYLMSLCKHNIVSNSTFSWWAAYLNKNKSKKVIAPRDFFYPKYKDNSIGSAYYFFPNYEERIRDLWPKEWILIEDCFDRND